MIHEQLTVCLFIVIYPIQSDPVLSHLNLYSPIHLCEFLFLLRHGTVTDKVFALNYLLVLARYAEFVGQRVLFWRTPRFVEVLLEVTRTLATFQDLEIEREDTRQGFGPLKCVKGRRIEVCSFGGWTEVQRGVLHTVACILEMVVGSKENLGFLKAEEMVLADIVEWLESMLNSILVQESQELFLILLSLLEKIGPLLKIEKIVAMLHPYFYFPHSALVANAMLSIISNVLASNPEKIELFPKEMIGILLVSEQLEGVVLFLDVPQIEYIRSLGINLVNHLVSRLLAAVGSENKILAAARALRKLYALEAERSQFHSCTGDLIVACASSANACADISQILVHMRHFENKTPES